MLRRYFFSIVFTTFEALRTCTVLRMKFGIELAFAILGDATPREVNRRVRACRLLPPPPDSIDDLEKAGYNVKPCIGTIRGS